MNLQAAILRGGYRGTLVLAGGNTPRENFYMQVITVHLAPPMFSPDQCDDYRRTIEYMNGSRLPLKALVSHRFNLSEIGQAFASLKSLGSGLSEGHRIK